jgi:hypothetical protein
MAHEKEKSLSEEHEYHHKKQEFEPKYFSALNWREISPFIDKPVEVSTMGDTWEGPHRIRRVAKGKDIVHRFLANCKWYPFARTCPETFETLHPTINIGGVKLPMPEVNAPQIGTKYRRWKPGCKIFPEFSWQNSDMELGWLSDGVVHLTQSRVLQWRDWWQNYVCRTARKKGEKVS